MSTPTQQVCARCGSPADDGDAFCGNCGASISRPVTQLPPSDEYLQREPGTDSSEHTESAHDPRLSSSAGQFDPQAQAPGSAPSDPPPLSPQPDWTDTVRSFVRRMPVWARLVALGVAGLLILLAVQGIKDSGASSSAGGGGSPQQQGISGDAAVCKLIYVPVTTPDPGSVGSQGWDDPEPGSNSAEKSGWQKEDAAVANAGAVNDASLDSDLGQFQSDWTSSDGNILAPAIQQDLQNLQSDCQNLGYS